MPGFAFRAGHRAGWNAADFMTALAIVTAAGGFQRLGAKKIDAGIGYNLGWGATASQSDADGRIFMDIRDNAASPGAETQGDIRIDVHDPTDHVIETLCDFRTEQLRTVLADRTKQIAFAAVRAPGAAGVLIIGEDYSFVIKFRPDVDVTVSHLNTKIFMDVGEWTRA